MKKIISVNFILFLIIFNFNSCMNQTPGETEEYAVTVEVENFTSKNGNITVETSEDDDSYVVSDSKGDWLAFETQIPVAGRYKCEIKVHADQSSPDGVWIEDYYDNEDDRTYNITSTVSIPSANAEEFEIMTKFGCPLNKGLHKMKLHFEEGSIKADWIKFTLIKKHQDTPKVMEQNFEGEEWNLVWSDEFEGSGLPDTSKWLFDVGNWGWGNNEPQYYTEYRTENARQENGSLIIEARKNDMDQPWTSARLTTRGKVSFLYGKIEFKAKVPSGDGTWAAGWLLGDSYRDEISWPYCGEIDVMECVGREIDDQTGDGINHASCHTRAYYFKQGNHITSTIPVKNMTGEFHSYAIEWTPQAIHAFVDGEKYYTYDKTESELSWPFNDPQNIIVNLAMGGGMGGSIDKDLETQKLIVDYIRVYEKI